MSTGLLSSAPGPAPAGGPPASGRSPQNWSTALFGLCLTATLFLIYRPAWHGGLLWDDDGHVTSPGLQSVDGLRRIWCQIGATLQYYPLLHSAFWLEHRLWGDATLGYHLLNIALHAAAALLVLKVLLRLKIPGAYLAAAIFALHPVQVESVAWITEQKNTLSTILYLGAALLYLRFYRARALSWYLGASGIFLLALLTKTVTGTLPAALLVVLWWQHGRLSWRRDVLPLLPLLLLGAIAGRLTAWWEIRFNLTTGKDFDYSPIERLLIAGRATWFFVGKLLWPADLMFSYPRWDIDPRADWQYLYPAAALGLVAGAFALRHRSRGVLACVLFFGGTLVPVLGFFNLYTFRYSFVADHYQYLACLGPIVLASAGTARLLQRTTGWARRAGQGACVAVLALLSVLSLRQCRIYRDGETLYRATLARNPACWMAHNNLGLILKDSGRPLEAVEHLEQALRIKPDYVEAHNNLGSALAGLGRLTEAREHFQRALQIEPRSALAHDNLGTALQRSGQYLAALEQFEQAAQIQPDDALAHQSWGTALLHLGRPAEAIEQLRLAARLKPDYAEAHNNWGAALVRLGRLDEAIIQYEQAVQIRPDYAMAQQALAAIRAQVRDRRPQSAPPK